jgi:hypothetical protein
MFSRVWWLSTIERMGKTFVQAYLSFWLLAAGLADSDLSQPNADAFEVLFTMNNLKAAVVATALSFVTSLASTPAGPDHSPSLTVTESTPTVPAT